MQAKEELSCDQTVGMNVAHSPLGFSQLDLSGATALGSVQKEI